MPTVQCSVCGLDVERRQAEINRSRKLGRATYCSLTCSGKGNVGNIPLECRVTDHLKKGRDSDEFSPFRWHHHNIRTRCTAKGTLDDVQVTVEDLKSQWDKQQGKCPYTGWDLLSPATTAGKIPRTPNRASVDRIDSTLGYTKDNIQFVSLMAQFAKNDWTPEDVIAFGEAVVSCRVATS